MTSGNKRPGANAGWSRRARGARIGVATAIALTMMPAISGCTRTSDGSIEPIVPLTLDAMPPLRPIGWGRTAAAEPPTTMAATDFPDAPEAPQKRRSYGKRVTPKAAAVPRFGMVTKPILSSAVEQPAKPITCREATTTSGKKRVVCD